MRARPATFSLLLLLTAIVSGCTLASPRSWSDRQQAARRAKLLSDDNPATAKRDSATGDKPPASAADPSSNDRNAANLADKSATAPAAAKNGSPFVSSAERKHGQLVEGAAHGSTPGLAPGDSKGRVSLGSGRSPKTGSAATDSGATTAAKPANGSTPAAAKTGPAGAASSVAGATQFSPESLELIDRELADADADEREFWFNQLKKVDPAVIPEILQARRLSMKLDQQLAGGREASLPSNSDDWLGDNQAPSKRVSGAAAGEVPAGETNEPIQLVGAFGHSSDRSSGRGAAARAANDSVQQAAASRESTNARTPAAGQPAAGEAAAVAAGTSPNAVTSPGQPDASPVITPRRRLAAATGIAFSRSDNARPDATRLDGNRPDANSTPTGESWPAAPVKPETKESAGRGFPNLGQVLPGVFRSTNHPHPDHSASAPPAANVTPVATVATDSGISDLDRLIASTEQRLGALSVSTTSDPTERLRVHVQLRQLYLMSGQIERALAPIPGIDPADQEFWQQMVWAMANYFDNEQIPDARDRAGQTVNQLQTAIRHLQERANLEIRNLAFCRQIDYFGNYTRFPRDEFRPGDEVLLYAELDNFKSEPTPEGQYRTLLRSSVEIVSPAGEIRKHIDFPATEDLCRNPRRDYFHNYQFTIPERIPLGPHLVKLTVVDELSGKMMTATAHFVVR